ncbi:unnamed protein product [Meganyctiphanes norvegica]|uniref:Platelet-derived growth factor (PDGF) family profile domain-containing protein n=1 Tax=Meganyctiphanes norvegica TaxID=48144 RepID=A0AAV2SJG0_MEGNR
MKLNYLPFYVAIILLGVYSANSVPVKSKRSVSVEDNNLVDTLKDSKNLEPGSQQPPSKTLDSKQLEPGSQQPPTKTPTRREIRKQKKLDKKFQSQLEALYKLGCKPKKFKVPIRSLFKSTDAILDQEALYPEFVVLEKCDVNCTFCKLKQDTLGIEGGVCTSSRKKKKTILVKYLNDENEWEFKNVETKEDRKCKCKTKISDPLYLEPAHLKNKGSIER